MENFSVRPSARIITLDYLRGLAALGIMVYHHSLWMGYTFTSETFLGKVGFYGVSIFYILSGLTLFSVYSAKMNFDRASLIDFYVKRVFRILPLLWLTIFVTLVLRQAWPNPVVLILNLTGLFGVVKWDAYIGTGVWSIGNEICFYLFFPLAIFAARRSGQLLLLLVLITFSVYVAFAFFIIDRQGTIVDQWSLYINPLNQLFLFIAGVALGHFFNRSRILYAHFFLIAALVVFVLYPVSGNTINLVTGVDRLGLTAVAIIICLLFYKLEAANIPAIIGRPLQILGEISYSVYLLHPIVFKIYTIINDRVFEIPVVFRAGISMVTTLLISYLVYEKFEKYFMNIGRQVSAKFQLFRITWLK